MTFSFDFTQYVLYGLYGLLILSVLVQAYYYLGIYLRLLTYKRVPQLNSFPVSVIICARNEAENLKKNLPAILTQDYKKFEVVVVDDCSTDDTELVLNVLMKKYKRLRTTKIIPDKKFTHGKKLAITVGIKAAQYEWLVFTDADCIPVSDQWLNRIQENFSDQTEIVLGYGAYHTYDGWLNKYIRYDTVTIAIQYLSYALKGTPYMGVGRNLAYKKSLFFKNKGFASHYNILSGDDDLFVNEVANKKNTSIEFHPESFTVSEPKFKWKQWIIQKRRHFITANRYKAKHIFMLGAEPLTRALFYLTFIVLLSIGVNWPYILGLGLLRFIFMLVIIKLSVDRLHEKKLMPWIVIFDFISMFINFILYLTTSFRSKKLKWK